MLHDTSINLTRLNSKPKEFECGTSELLKTQLIESGLTNPDNFNQLRSLVARLLMGASHADIQIYE